MQNHLAKNTFWCRFKTATKSDLTQDKVQVVTQCKAGEKLDQKPRRNALVPEKIPEEFPPKSTEKRFMIHTILFKLRE